MPNELSGRSALLKQRIEKLAREQDLLRTQIGGASGSGAIHNAHEQELEKLRRELRRELALKRVVVFGTTHQLQEKGDDLNCELKARLSYLIAKFAVTVVLEEWAADRRSSFASTLGSEHIAYKDVGTPSEEQFQTFCNPSINHPAHDGTLGPCEDAPQFCEYGPLDKQENREQRMVQNIQHEMANHRVGLFIVGLAHLHSISMKLQQADFNVAAYSWIG